MRRILKIAAGMLGVLLAVSFLAFAYFVYSPLPSLPRLTRSGAAGYNSCWPTGPQVYRIYPGEAASRIAACARAARFDNGRGNDACGYRL